MKNRYRKIIKKWISNCVRRCYYINYQYKKHIFCRNFDENGNIVREGPYLNGMQTGIWKDCVGNKIFCITWNNTTIHGISIYYEI